MTHTAQDCQAKNPALCRYHGHIRSNKSRGFEAFKAYMGFSSDPRPTPFTPANAADMVQHALTTNLRWEGKEPTWWRRYRDGVSKYADNARPQLLDVIKSPVGDLAVIWQEESVEQSDLPKSLKNGTSMPVVYFKSVKTARVFGHLKVSQMTEESYQRSFGDDEFTPYRWAAGQRGNNTHSFADVDGEVWGERNLAGDALNQKRRDVWLANRGEFPTLQLPDDETVRGDLAVLGDRLRQQSEDDRRYYSNSFVISVSVDEKIQGKGYGSALYMYSARKLGEQGQVLRGSNVQTNDGKTVWRNFGKRMNDHVSTVSLTHKGSTSSYPTLDLR